MPHAIWLYGSIKWYLFPTGNESGMALWFVLTSVMSQNGRISVSCVSLAFKSLFYPLEYILCLENKTCWPTASQIPHTEWCPYKSASLHCSCQLNPNAWITTAEAKWTTTTIRLAYWAYMLVSSNKCLLLESPVLGWFLMQQ